MNASHHADRLQVLDGWRGLSILLVLACHLLPLGPKHLQLNNMAGPAGMALFFTLSGFLITRLLLRDANVGGFLIRRLCRIVPLAWLGLAFIFLLDQSPVDEWLPNILFYSNLPPQHLSAVGAHYWSLCVEVQFYLGIALVVALLGSRGLYLIPVLCLLVTAHRVAAEAYVDIVTWRRTDEILAGGVLALAFEGKLGKRASELFTRTNVWFLLALLLIASHPAGGPVNYARPYIAALLVGSTLYSPPPLVFQLLTIRPLTYIASISYALYVIHPIVGHTWLGTGDTMVKYLKRPLLFVITFALAHLSTYYFESRFVALGKYLSRGRSA